MDLRFTLEENAFREEVRTFLKGALPEPIRKKMVEGRSLSKDDIVTWQRILNKKGWAVPNWSKEWGGTGWTPVQQHIYQEEREMLPAPDPLPFGVNMLGPVLIAFGTEAQKKRFLPRIANIDDWWCQGFSEPGSGSDLASLKTSAKRDGDFYIVNGQKTWTTLAQYADWIFCLVRTDVGAKKQEGISFLLIDMKSKGITVRPIQTIDGASEVNEVFFDDVKVPVENLIGQENKGWDYAKFLLGNERTGIARVGVSKERIRRLKSLAAIERSGDKPLIEDPAFPRQDRGGRGGAEGARDDAAARHRRRAHPEIQPAQSGLVDPEDQGIGNPASHHGACARSGRALRAALRAQRGRPPQERALRRTGMGGADRADLFQLPQDIDLWRLERNPEEHHRQGRPGAVMRQLIQVMAGRSPAMHVLS